jgi:hypothetical protein
VLQVILAAGLLLVPAAALPADRAPAASTPPTSAATPPSEERPGYGVVESIVALDAGEAEASASAGASREIPPGRRKAERYLIRVRMDDGTVQIRTADKREVREGERVLITNAGDIVPE